MRNFESEIYQVWRPELDDVIQRAIQSRSAVHIKSLLPLDKCNFADATLIGRFSAIYANYQAQFLVDAFDLSPTSNFPAAPECEYLFQVDNVAPKGAKSRMEYGGRAFIVDSELKKNNLPSGLLLRLSFPSSIKRLRLHARCQCDRVMMPGLMLIDQNPPTGRRKLLALLAHYYQDQKRPKPEIVNISAGGACLRTYDAYCQKFLGADENYLFFFFTNDGQDIKTPHVFICKKVGAFRDQKSSNAGLRLKFIRELVWTRPEDDLKWRDVDSTGSAVLKNVLEQSAPPRQTGK